MIKKKLFTFYREEDNNGHYFIYDIENDSIIKNSQIITNCVNNDYNKFKLFYFHETKEYVFACFGYNNHISLVRMNSEFSNDNNNDYYFGSINSFTIVYDNQNNSYI